MNILCIDPGTTHSGVIGLSGTMILRPEPELANEDLLEALQKDWYEVDLMLIEMVACYGKSLTK